MIRITHAPIDPRKATSVAQLQKRFGKLMFVAIARREKPSKKPAHTFSSWHEAKAKLLELFSHRQIFGYGSFSIDEAKRLTDIPITTMAVDDKQQLEIIFDQYWQSARNAPIGRATKFEIYVEDTNLTPIGGFAAKLAIVVYSRGEEMIHSEVDLGRVKFQIDQLKRFLIGINQT